MITGEGEMDAPAGSLLPPGIGFSESMLYGPEQKSIVAYPWKYVYDMTTGGCMLSDLMFTR